MFEMLISCKKEVSIRCGKDEIRGVITNYYPTFRLLKLNNVLIPIVLIEQIEVLEPVLDSLAQSQNHRENRSLRLVAQGRNYN
jgi:hypothetical protein